jgi:hypothetical protein
MNIKKVNLKYVYEDCRSAISERSKSNDAAMDDKNTVMVADWIFASVYETVVRQRVLFAVSIFINAVLLAMVIIGGN